MKKPSRVFDNLTISSRQSLSTFIQIFSPRLKSNPAIVLSSSSLGAALSPSLCTLLSFRASLTQSHTHSHTHSRAATCHQTGVMNISGYVVFKLLCLPSRRRAKHTYYSPGFHLGFSGYRRKKQSVFSARCIKE